MRERTLARFVEQMREAQPGHELVFAWQGGEPTLMGLPCFARAWRTGSAQTRGSGARLREPPGQLPRDTVASFVLIGTLWLAIESLTSGMSGGQGERLGGL